MKKITMLIAVVVVISAAVGACCGRSYHSCRQVTAYECD